eukprot:SAG22_NODE_202_length_15324_cov_7.802627_2_plen_204_part_00
MQGALGCVDKDADKQPPSVHPWLDAQQPKNRKGLPEGSYLASCIGCSLEKVPPPPAAAGGEPKEPESAGDLKSCAATLAAGAEGSAAAGGEGCAEPRQQQLLKCTHCPDSSGSTKESTLDPATCDLATGTETIANLDGLLGCAPPAPVAPLRQHPGPHDWLAQAAAAAASDADAAGKGRPAVPGMFRSVDESLVYGTGDDSDL